MREACFALGGGSLHISHDDECVKVLLLMLASVKSLAEVMELGHRDSDNQLNWTIALSTELVGEDHILESFGVSL